MRIERSYFASADELYRAFVDVELLRQWFQPAAGLAATSAQVCDEPPGVELGFVTPVGDVTLRFTWRDPVPAQVAARSLVFALGRQDARGTDDSRVTVTFEPAVAPSGLAQEAAEQSGAQQTILVVQHDGLPAEQVAESEAGWRHCLGRLIGACPRALDAYYSRLQHPPGYRSKFGGFWPDRPDADARLAAKRDSGVLDSNDAKLFAHWLEKGYVVLKNAVSAERVDAFRDEIARDWERGNPDVTIELCEAEGGYHPMHPSLRDRPHKVLDYHGKSSNARDIQFSPAILRFLGQLFERPPMANQSLLFRYGTEQAMHQDTAYVIMRSPMEFVGCWVALEDVVEGSGELHYYEGSHRIPEFVWFDRSRGRPPGYDDDAEFLAWVEQQSKQSDCERVRFLPKKGDALVWHADLVHGGSPRVQRDLTRWSLVSHYCPVDVDPAWFDPASGTRHEHAPGAFYCQLSQAPPL